MKTYLETWEKIFGTRKTKRIFIAATRQNVGKTTVSIGLIAALSKRYKKIGFIKPVGQRYVLDEGHKIDEDTVLMQRVFGFRSPLYEMSPVA
ncbi:MAG: AAA family ATPase, partial [Candidatus Omnitrophica bacterium]|nr:AAA family ATPase [Candidatus Omnitrophota bacterium]